MANAEHLERLKQGSEVWNRWRENHPDITPDLRKHNLSQVNLSRFNLHGVDLSDSNLLGANFLGANLSQSNLQEADLFGVNLSQANLSQANLSGAAPIQADLSGANLSRANLSQASLRKANFLGANLSQANLYLTQASGTCFAEAIFTGACLEDWNTNSATKFDNAICEYVYLKANQQERRPRKGTFTPGEFSALFQQAVDTVDLILADGIDWQAFFQSFQTLRCQYLDQDLSIQALERRNNGAFVVRLEVPPEADKSLIERRAKELYEASLLLMEQRYRDVLQAKDGEIVAYREQSTNLMKITEMLAARPPMSEGNKYDLRGAQFGGGYVAGNVEGDQIGGTINNATAGTPSLVEAAAEIQNLLKQLEASNPAATEAEQTEYLSALIPPTRRERFVGALKAAGGAAIEEVPYGAVLKALVEGWQKPEG